ncbi:MAG: hypothetical protein LBJ70_03695 [Holosporales bacterium]|jgi:hypothetical protein|nr:hypothetical protein [Holosporales bacterium]
MMSCSVAPQACEILHLATAWDVSAWCGIACTTEWAPLDEQTPPAKPVLPIALPPSIEWAPQIDWGRKCLVQHLPGGVL